MDRLTRHELKSDKFVEEVGQTLTFLEEHKQQAIRYGGIALAVVVVVAGGWWFMKSRRETRQIDLTTVFQTYNAFVGPGTPPGQIAFPDQAAKNVAINKALNDYISKYSGTEEASVATYLLGVHSADQGKVADAERYLKKAAEDAGKDYASLAKLALCQVLAAEGKTAEAEKYARELMASPTLMVTKEQATLLLARVIAKTKPAEAKKLLEPLRVQTGNISRMAITEMAELGLAQ